MSGARRPRRHPWLPWQPTEASGQPPAPYYRDSHVTLYLGDALAYPDLWRLADVLVTDPPYGRDWSQGASGKGHYGHHRGIIGDHDSTARDQALSTWGTRAAVMFGDPLIYPPQGTRQALVYRKPPDAGTKGCYAGYRRDIEMVYLVGEWPAGLNGDTSVLTTGARTSGSPSGLAARHGHPHAKPVDVMCDLIARCPPGVVADPFAGSGSTLVAALMLGRHAIGMEIDEQYCEAAARRLSQQMLELR